MCERDCGDAIVEGGGALTAGGSRLAGVDVADNDDIDMSLLFTVDCVSCWWPLRIAWCEMWRLRTYPILTVFGVFVWKVLEVLCLEVLMTVSAAPAVMMVMNVVDLLRYECQ